VTFSEQPPSKQWAALKYGGETLAEVWFKPEGEPCALTLRIPQKSFQTPGIGQRLTTELLLKAVCIAAEEVESWRLDNISHSGIDVSDSELGRPLPSPSEDVSHLTVHVTLKPPQVVAPNESGKPKTASATWQDLEARWRAILGLEATIDALRLTVEGLRAELETWSKRPLKTEDKVNALNADVAQLNKVKSRAHYAVPKAREFIHRATWAMGTPERKKLEEIFKDDIRPELPVAEMEQLPEQLESLLKDWQVLSAQGVTVSQECKSISAELQGALRTLQTNAAANAQRKRREFGKKGKFV
jgi:hypothetical protein